MTPSGARWSGESEVPELVGLTVREARNLGHKAGFVVTAADVDGPPLGELTWPGIWVVTAQAPSPGTRLRRWENVVIEFEKLSGDGEGGVREPRRPLPDPGMFGMERDPTE